MCGSVGCENKEGMFVEHEVEGGLQLPESQK